VLNEIGYAAWHNHPAKVGYDSLVTKHR